MAPAAGFFPRLPVVRWCEKIRVAEEGGRAMRSAIGMCLAACVGIAILGAAEDRGGAESKAAPARGLFLIKRGAKYGYMDRAGKVVVEPRYDMALDCSEGLARVGAMGFIDRKGKTRIECFHTAKFDFDGGLARLVNEERKAWAYIDAKGRTVWTEDANAFGMGGEPGGGHADAPHGGKLWGLRVVFSGGNGNYTGTEEHIDEGTPKPPENPESYVFDPSAHKLVIARTTWSFGECSFADLPTPFFVYIRRPGFKPEWRWYDSTRQWYAITLTEENSKRRTRTKDDPMDPFPPNSGSTPTGTEFTPRGT
jgi:hypothetical protein